MQPISMNFFALLGFVAVRVVVGMFWYSPQGFWGLWSKETGIAEKDAKKGMPKAFAADLAGSFLMAVVVLLHAIKYAGAAGSLPMGLAVSFLNWLGFVASVQFAMSAYEQRSTKFFWVVSGYQLVTMLLGGAVLTLWG
jgi:hypothetical protein